MATIEDLKATAAHLVREGRGILAADESTRTLGKRLQAHGLDNTEETRRAFREILVTAPGNAQSYSGIILYDETVRQCTRSGTPFARELQTRGILMGVKVDTGLQPLAGHADETVTSGLDGLTARCQAYRRAGASFAKWRSALRVDTARGLPSEAAIRANACGLATYGRIAQACGLVPVLEPEVLLDGDYSAEDAEGAGFRVLTELFAQCQREGVVICACLLKVMMVLPGVAHAGRADVSSGEVGEATVRLMRRAVPEEVGGIVFLSGGMGEREATDKLQAVVREAVRVGVPWAVSFSFGRALQTSVLLAWRGEAGRAAEAGRLAAALGAANAAACEGRFDGVHPSLLDEGHGLYEGFRGWRGGEGDKSGNGV